MVAGVKVCRNARASRLLLVLAGSVLLAGCMRSDLGDLRQFVKETNQQAPPAKLRPLPKLAPYQPFYYQAQGLRDPFSPSKFVVDALTQRNTPTVKGSGIEPNTNRPREELEKYSLGALQLVGTFRDFNANQRMWALIKAPDGIVHRVHVGNYLGRHFGRIYNITENRVDIQEIVRDPQTGGWKKRVTDLSLAG